MSSSFIDFLNFAKSLTDNTEINHRNASSRAYYAAYHKCIESFGKVYDPTVKGGAHEQMIKYLLKGRDKSEISIGHQMNHIKSQRVLADYELTADFSKQESESAIMYATKIIDSLTD